MESCEPAPASTLRLLRLGDSSSYQVGGTLTPAGGEPLELTGQITVAIVSDRLLQSSESMTIVFSQQLQVTQPDGSKQAMPAPEWMFWFVQDASSRDLSITADNMTRDGSPRIAKVPQVFYPGSWSSRTGYSNRLDFDNGDCVDTEGGAFLSWKAKISSNSAATGLIEGMDWWTPELGAPAKFSTASKMPDGSEMRFVATLRSSSVQ